MVREEDGNWIEENVPEADSREEVKPSIIEDEVQIIHPPGPAHQVPAFIKTPQDPTPHYNKLRTKRPISSLGTPLNCERHIFSEDLSDISEK